MNLGILGSLKYRGIVLFLEAAIVSPLVSEDRVDRRHFLRHKTRSVALPRSSLGLFFPSCSYHARALVQWSRVGSSVDPLSCGRTVCEICTDHAVFV